MPVTSNCVLHWVQTGVPPWLFMPELPPEGATQVCTIGGPLQQPLSEPNASKDEPKDAPHEGWFEHAGHSLGAILPHHQEKHK